MTTEEELVALRARVREIIPLAHDFRHPLGEVPGKCGACLLYRDCDPKPVDPWKLLRSAQIHLPANCANLVLLIEAALAAHEREGKP